FFSSRRRHTRFSRDWSSDVCSSDLGTNGTGTTVRAPSATRRVRARLARRITAQRPASVKQVLEPLAAIHRELHPNADLALLQRRSEERRVGKEWRCGGSRER